MGPQAILLAVYGITQVAQMVMEQLKDETGLSDEDLKRLWEEQKENFLTAAGLWKASGK